MLNGVLDPHHFDDVLCTTATTFIPRVSGEYAILCIGAGGNGSTGGVSRGGAGGGAGGCGIARVRLVAGKEYAVKVAQKAGEVSSFGDIITCTSGSSSDSWLSAGDNGTAAGDSVAQVRGSSAGVGSGAKIQGKYYDTHYHADIPYQYIEFGPGGGIGNYTDYGFANTRQLLSRTVYATLLQTRLGQEEMYTSAHIDLSNITHGGYGTYGAGGYGGSYFFGGQVRTYDQGAGGDITISIKVMRQGNYFGEIALDITGGNPGCVVIKLLRL